MSLPSLSIWSACSAAHSSVRMWLTLVSDPTPLVVTGIGSVEGMSYDWISKNLYFTDFRRSTVSVVRVDHPSWRRDLIKDLGNARSIVVHPLRGLVSIYSVI